MTSINHSLVATSELTCPSLPEQHEGTLTDGRWFYFRYRWGWASLGVGTSQVAAVDDSDDHQRRVGDSGYGGEFASPEQREAVFADLLAEAAP